MFLVSKIQGIPSPSLFTKIFNDPRDFVSQTVSNPGPILLVHNYYQQRGGEDRVFEDEVLLLRNQGLEVHTFVLHNNLLKHMHPLRTVANTLWNRRVALDLADLVARKGIRIAHFHNTFPLISPSVYRATRRAGAAVVQTLHNYRLLCAGATFFRGSGACNDCLNRVLPWPALHHRCYRQNRAATLTVVAMQLLHRSFRTWTKNVDAYIALTEGAKSCFANTLLPANHIQVLGNFQPRGLAPTPLPEKGPALFIGRLDEAKGTRILLKAWENHPTGMPNLIIIGDGPLSTEVQKAAENDSRITWMGQCTADEIQVQMRLALIVLIPSISPETYSLVLLEARKAARPVIGSKIGALQELISHDEDGWLVPPGAPDAIYFQLNSALENKDALQKAANTAYQRYLKENSPDFHLYELLKIYKNAIINHKHSQ